MKKEKIKKLIYCFLVSFFITSSALAQKIRIACVGNSITAGAKLNDPRKNLIPHNYSASWVISMLYSISA